MWRAGIRHKNVNSIVINVCFHHEAELLHKYTAERSRDKCCDLFCLHKTKRVKANSIITLDLAEKLCSLYPTIIPGKKLCLNCYKKATKMEPDITNVVDDEEDNCAMELSFEKAEC